MSNLVNVNVNGKVVKVDATFYDINDNVIDAPSDAIYNWSDATDGEIVEFSTQGDNNEILIVRPLGSGTAVVKLQITSVINPTLDSLEATLEIEIVDMVAVRFVLNGTVLDE